VIVVVTPEMMIPEFPESARGANFRGGLGILSGDIMVGLAKGKVEAVGIIPLYKFHWMTHEKIDYSNTLILFELKVNGKLIKVREIQRGGCKVFGLESNIFNILYVADRWQRFQQEVLLGHAVAAVLKRLNIKPDIVWLQEGHTVVTIPALKKDPYFAETKFLFTTHTPAPEGMEKFPGDNNWFNELKIDQKIYHSIFVRNGVIDMTRAAMILADAVNAVSLEHMEVVKKMFPEFASKIIGIRNGSDRDLWLSPHLKELNEEFSLSTFLNAQQSAKKDLLRFLVEKTGIRFDLQKPVLGWVRRIAWYKQQYPILAPIIKAICAERGERIDTPLGKLEGLGFQVFSAGRAHESDSTCLGWMAEFQNWMDNPLLSGKFIFLPEYSFKLLRLGAQGCDVWLSCPLPEWEACGTSDQRAAINGRVNLTTKAGGAKEYIVEGNNGFFIEPYEPRTVYNKLKIISDLYYTWIEKNGKQWPNICRASFEAGKSLDILPMIEKYKKIFESLK